MTWALVTACALSSVPAGLRWLRVAQREHYLPPATTRFALRWWGHGPVNRGLVLLAAVGVVGTFWSPWYGFLVAAAQFGPVGLAVRGRTSSLAWTSRLRRLAGLTAILILLAYVVGGFMSAPLVVVVALFSLPSIVDLSLLILNPWEHRLGTKWVERAATRLRGSGADVVAITGSYGKTSTKAYLAHLLGKSRRVVASPASFNNRMGLARAINEQLVPGTEVFIAEMGTYGPGEIAELCNWIPPKVGAIVSIGPVHLERFRTEERIVEAKSEILDRADLGVIAVDNPLLAELAERRSVELDLIEVATPTTRVYVDGGRLMVDDQEVAEIPAEALATNLCVAVGICLALGLEPVEFAPGLGELPVTAHRQAVAKNERGVTIIDDTYNSNPVGAQSALKRLSQLAGDSRTAVVTPGMVELGPRQDTENEEFARRAAAVADDLLIVGGTNRTALLRGAAGGNASITVVGSRDQAVAWVREHLGEGDVVLYENDLPDHYP